MIDFGGFGFKTINGGFAILKNVDGQFGDLALKGFASGLKTGEWRISKFMSRGNKVEKAPNPLDHRRKT